MGRLLEGDTKNFIDRIVDLASKVYQELKPFGFVEEREYESALAYEFRRNGLKYLEQLQVDIMYEQQHIVKGGKIDFIVFDEEERIGILVELKLASDLKGESLDQILKYYNSLKRNTHFPSFISSKIVGGIVLVWDKDQKMLLSDFKSKIYGKHIPYEQVDYGESKGDIEMIVISVDRA